MTISENLTNYISWWPQTYKLNQCFEDNTLIKVTVIHHWNLHFFFCLCFWFLFLFCFVVGGGGVLLIHFFLSLCDISREECLSHRPNLAFSSQACSIRELLKRNSHSALISFLHRGVYFWSLRPTSLKQIPSGHQLARWQVLIFLHFGCSGVVFCSYILSLHSCFL